MSLASCYRTLTTPFGEKADYYSRPQGHSGADYRASVGDPVLAYEDITITTVRWSYWLGWCVEGRADDGRYIGWAHLRHVRVRVGQAVRKLGQVAEVAGADDRPGETWFGAHIHTTLSDQAEGIFEGPTLDPAPRIRAALGGSTTAGGTTAELNESEEDDDMAKNSGMYWRRRADGKTEYCIYNTDSGFRANHSGVDAAYNNRLAKALDTPPWAEVTEAHAKVIMAAVDAVRVAR